MKNDRTTPSKEINEFRILNPERIDSDTASFELTRGKSITHARITREAMERIGSRKAAVDASIDLMDLFAAVRPEVRNIAARFCLDRGPINKLVIRRVDIDTYYDD